MDFINLASPASQQVPGYSSLLPPLAMLGIQIQQTPAVGLGAPSLGLHVCTADNLSMSRLPRPQRIFTFIFTK